MSYIGSRPANKPVNQTDIEDDAISLAKLAGGTDGNVISYDASGNPVAIATGSDGQVLTSTGAGSPPAFESVSAGVSLSGTTNNTVATVTGSNALAGESNLQFDGSSLTVTGSLGVGTAKDLGSGIHIKIADSGGSVETNAEQLVIERNVNSGMTILSGANDTGNVYFGDSGDADIGRLTYHHNGNAMSFTTNASEKIRILDSGGITFNGDTATTNALDDYDEGNWTPTWVLGTSGSCNTANASGKYVKIGAQVTVWGYNAFGGTVSSPTGSIKIGGLPFTPADGYGQSNSFFGQGWVSGAWGWGNAGGSNNSASDGYHPRAITVRTDGLQLITWGVTGDKPWGPGYDLVGQTNTMYGGSSNHGQMYFGAVYRVAA